MRILVTGDAGFIGKHIFAHLYNNGYEVQGCSRRTTGGRSKVLLVDGNSSLRHEYDNFHFVIDLKDSKSVIKMLADFQPELIIHCAANAAPQAGIDGAENMYLDNVVSTFNLAKEAPDNCKFIFLSSIVVYGDVKSDVPTRWIDACSITSPTSLYGLTKLQSENIIRFYRNMENTKILRLGAVTGPGLTHGIIKDFIFKLKSSSYNLQVLGDRPGSSKPFLHISDLLRVINLCVENRTDKPNTYNICNKDQANVEEIANAVMDVMGIHKPIEWLGASANWKGDNKILRANVDNLGAGWQPSLNSIEAIRLAVKENL